MGPAGRERERAARSDAVQAALRVEGVEERVQVVLVGPAPMQEDERAPRLAGCRTLTDVEIVGRGAAPLGIFAR